MKITLIIVALVVVAALGIWAYFRPAPTPIQTAIPDKLTEPVIASSYGKDAVGDETTNAPIQPSQLTPQEVGVLQGVAGAAAGATPDLSSIRLSISDPQTKKVLSTINLGADGSYKFIVTPGEYIIDIVAGTGSSKQLPQRIYVGAGEVLNKNFSVK